MLAAVDQFDRIGRDAFLRSGGYRRATAYFLEHASRLYDSTAIAGYAHGVGTGTSLNPDDFSGGDQTVARRLQALGFTVLNLQRPDWTRDEISLACELVEANGWRQLEAGNDRVRELSDFLILHSPRIHPGHPGIRHPDFRNTVGVARKTHNIAECHPDYQGRPSNGNHLDQLVLDDFRDDPARMHALVARIRELLTADDRGRDELPDLDTTDLSGTEGGIALREHLRRERNPELRRKKLADVKRRGQPVPAKYARLTYLYRFRGQVRVFRRSHASRGRAPLCSLFLMAAGFARAGPAWVKGRAAPAERRRRRP